MLKAALAIVVLLIISLYIYREFYLRNLPRNLPHFDKPQASISPASNADHPNILFILTDDLDAKSIEYMPKLKSLIADQGVSFSHYYISFSLCCPSRATTLRGQYAHNTHILGNGPPAGGFKTFYQLGEESSTIGTWLYEAGYRTGLMGKYLNGYPTGAGPTYVPPGWSEWDVSDETGYANFNYNLNENGKLAKYGSSSKDYLTDVLSSKAKDFIEKSAQDKQPFFLYLATFAPHEPSIPAFRHQDLFKDIKLPHSPSFNEQDVSDKPVFMQKKPLLDEEQINLLDLEYGKRIRSLQAVDEMVADLVASLEKNNQLDNTYIFFSSDNGFHMGEHRLPFGKNTGYEEDILVPLMVRGPKIDRGKLIDELVGNVDLSPTFAAIAGVKTPEFVDGRSFLPLLSGESVNNWRKVYLIEKGMLRGNTKKSAQVPISNYILDPPDVFAASRDILNKNGGVPALRGLRTKNYSYIEYQGGGREFYDMNKDPFELNNIYHQAPQSLLQKLSNTLSILQNCEGQSCRDGEESFN